MLEKEKSNRRKKLLSTPSLSKVMHWFDMKITSDIFFPREFSFAKHGIFKRKSIYYSFWIEKFMFKRKLRTQLETEANETHLDKAEYRFRMYSLVVPLMVDTSTATLLCTSNDARVIKWIEDTVITWVILSFMLHLRCKFRVRYLMRLINHEREVTIRSKNRSLIVNRKCVSDWTEIDLTNIPNKFLLTSISIV